MVRPKSDIQPHGMAAHARLKNEFTEDEKYHNLMAWLTCVLKGALYIMQVFFTTYINKGL